MSTCRGCMNLRAFRFRYSSSQYLIRHCRVSTTGWSRPRLARSITSHSSNAAPPSSRRQQRNSSSISRLASESTESTPESTEPVSEPTDPISESTEAIESTLPVCCPGCGAYSQTVDPNEPGYYSKARKLTPKRLAETKRVLEGNEKDNKEKDENSEEEENLALRTEGENAAREIRELTNPSKDEDGPPKPVDKAALEEATATAADYLVKSATPVQICDRCHNLKHHNVGVSAVSPSLNSIRELLNQSPWKTNHVYHILDAADFPMSLIPKISHKLDLPLPASANRRAKSDKFHAGKRWSEMTFIITRADLLAPTRELVDKKMGYMHSLLREALQKHLAPQKTAEGKPPSFRLGRVNLISCFRGYYVKPVKERIRKEGGAVWLIGKTNVGKSQFIETCFPKDSTDHEKIAKLVERRQKDSKPHDQEDDSADDPDQLLPPAPREDLYPVLPVVSSLSGTTVSPIRIPFGRGKGEIIDLPGVHRDGLHEYVEDKLKNRLIMNYPIRNPARQVVKKDQSLILGGGLVRVTTMNPDHVLIAACFVPIESHVTNTEKAIAIQTEQTPYPKEGGLMKPGVGELIKRAAEFPLQWDVTAKSLPVKMQYAVEDRRMKVSDLPYKVFAGDLLIEGCGWIELSIQVRTKDMEDPESVPRVEVFTPKGRHVGWRQPMMAYTHVEQRKAKERVRHPAQQRRNIGLRKRQAGGSKDI